MKKILLLLISLFLTSQTIKTQTENEYQEKSFQGTEEQTYSPKEEVFLIYSGNISNKYMVFGELPNKNSYSITINYEKNILTIKMGTTANSSHIDHPIPI